MNEIPILEEQVIVGDDALGQAGDVGDARLGPGFDLLDRPRHPARVQMHLGEDEFARGLTVFGDRPLRDDLAHHLLRRPAHRGHGGDAEALEDLRPVGIVDAGGDIAHTESLAGDTRGEDIRIVTAGDRGEREGLGGLRLRQGLTVETDPCDRRAAEIATEFEECVGVPVDDGDGVPIRIKGLGQGCPDSAAAHNHEVHGFSSPQ